MAALERRCACEDATPLESHHGLAFWSSIVGWDVLGFFEAVRRFTGEEVNCVARRGAAYQECVRGGDLTLLTAHSIALGFAMVGLLVAGRGFHRQRRNEVRDSRLRLAAGSSAWLVVASVLLWIAGNLGDWEPDRPFPYDPVEASQANTVMAVGMVVGMLVGLLFPLGRTVPDGADGSEA